MTTGSLQRKVYESFQGPNWNFQKGYLESFLGMLPGRFLEGNSKSFKYLSMKYYMEALREVPKSLHKRLSKMSMGSFCGDSWKLIQSFLEASFLSYNLTLREAFMEDSRKYSSKLPGGNYPKVRTKASKKVPAYPF